MKLFTVSSSWRTRDSQMKLIEPTFFFVFWFFGGFLRGEVIVDSWLYKTLERNKFLLKNNLHVKTPCRLKRRLDMFMPKKPINVYQTQEPFIGLSRSLKWRWLEDRRRIRRDTDDCCSLVSCPPNFGPLLDSVYWNRPQLVWPNVDIFTFIYSNQVS